MWKKLNTAPYYVSGFGEIPPWIHEEFLLPSYVNLSKCMNPDFIPSVNIVNKIVQFYNANISPSVDTYTFIHERLEDTDRGRTALVCSSAAPYCGLYYCYYYAEAEDEQYISGALLDIFESGGEIRARMIAGIAEDSDLCNPSLQSLLCSDDLTPEKFEQYKSGLPLAKRMLTMYSGAGKINPGVMTLQFQRADQDGTFLTLFMPLSPSGNSQFIGSLGILTLISAERTFQLFRSGFELAGDPELKPLSLVDPKLKELLAMKKGSNEHVSMYLSDNTKWTNYMILHCGADS